MWALSRKYFDWLPETVNSSQTKAVLPHSPGSRVRQSEQQRNVMLESHEAVQSSQARRRRLSVPSATNCSATAV
jgi:hypothetical protein